ncbi:MAG: TIGR04282 family arsenosugar biosynthesis glycosyltransferase [Pseudomonadota bacterium]
MTDPFNDCAVVVFTRAPILGQVKTRLAQTIGEEAALGVHVRLVGSALNSVTETGLNNRYLYVSVDHPEVRDWAQRFDLDVRLQRGDGLGERMRTVFRDLFESEFASGGGIERAVLMGTDCPDITAKYLHTALGKLAHEEVVVGPAEDGGYGLIGMRLDAFTQAQGVFQDIPWGSNQVMQRTREVLRDQGLKWAELSTIWDVDTHKDWERLQALGDARQDK